MAFGKKLKFWLLKQTDYDAFAADFAETREREWPEMTHFRKKLMSLSRSVTKRPYRKHVLDAGCGNGRFFSLIEEAGAKAFGIDASEKMAAITRKNFPGRDVFHGKLEAVPFPDRFFDVVFAFASLPHLATARARKRAFYEAYRVLQPGGFFAGTVWNLDQARFLAMRKTAARRAFFFPWWSKNDLVIPWGKEKNPRLYHRFTFYALKQYLHKAGFEEIEIFGIRENEIVMHAEKNICFWARKPERISLLDIPVDPICKSEALQKLCEFASGNKPMFVITPNPEICIAAKTDPEYKKILQSAHLSVPDGIGMLWAADYLHSDSKSRFTSLLRFALKKSSHILPERVCGSDLFSEFCRNSKEPVFLLGGKEGVAERCATCLNAKGAHIIGTDAGRSSEDDEERIIRKINDSRAKVLFVAFGAPTQEKWIFRHYHRLPNIRLAMGIGGSFDFVAGEQVRAPALFRKWGLEWAWRLAREPIKRVARIKTAIWTFPKTIEKEKRASKGQRLK